MASLLCRDGRVSSAIKGKIKHAFRLCPMRRLPATLQGMAKGGRPKSIHKRSERLNTSATPQEAANYEEACRAVDVEPADTLRKLASAFVEHVKEHKSITFPIRFQSPTKGHR
jgi:hypothetical protein